MHNVVQADAKWATLKEIFDKYDADGVCFFPTTYIQMASWSLTFLTGSGDLDLEEMTLVMKAAAGSHIAIPRRILYTFNYL